MITYTTSDDITVTLTPEEHKAIENAIAASMSLGPLRYAIEAKFDEAVERRDACNERARAGMAQEEERKKVRRQPIAFELHLSPHVDNFTRKFGKKIRAMGGKYTKCLGYKTERYVHIPNTEKGRALVDELLKLDIAAVPSTTKCRNPGPVVIARGISGQSLPAWVTVHKARSVEEMMTKLSKAIDQAVERGIVRAEYVEAA